MKIWLLKRLATRPTYDCNDGFVIRAETEEQARQMASIQRGDEGSECWLSAEHSTCVELLSNGDAEIVLTDFHAG